MGTSRIGSFRESERRTKKLKIPCRYRGLQVRFIEAALEASKPEGEDTKDRPVVCEPL